MSDWSDFEDYVREVYTVLLNLRNEGTVVTRDAEMIGRRSETPHQIDVFYEFVRAGIRHRVAIECKNTQRPVEKAEVTSFYGVVQDIGDVIGVMVSRSGYQSGALRFAEAHNILALTPKDLPTIMELASSYIRSYFLPDESAIGEPFWAIVQLDNGENTGAYFTAAGTLLLGQQKQPFVPLFISKQHALVAVGKIGQTDAQWGVRGVPQHVLRGLLASGYIGDWQFVICPFGVDLNSGKVPGMRFSAQEIARDFLLSSLAFEELDKDRAKCTEDQ